MTATFKTENPYPNDYDESLIVTCDDTHHVAYMFEKFNTEERYDYVNLTDQIDNNEILSKLIKTKFDQNLVIR